MALLKKEQLNLLCKMENIIRENKDTIFNKDGKCFYEVYDFDEKDWRVETVREEDFEDFVAMIEEFFREKSQAKDKARDYMRSKRAINKDYGRSK